MVGGPSVMPTVRRQVSAALGLPPEEGLDPMTLVAQGAAIYAATAGLEARPAALEPVRGAKIWLQYPAMSSDLTPHVVGRLVERGRASNVVPSEVRLSRADGLWDTPWTGLDEEGAFVLAVSLIARRPNVFRLEGRSATGGAVVLDPPTLTIVQGLTISDPPLSRTIRRWRGEASMRIVISPFFAWATWRSAFLIKLNSTCTVSSSMPRNSNSPPFCQETSARSASEKG